MKSQSESQKLPISQDPNQTRQTQVRKSIKASKISLIVLSRLLNLADGLVKYYISQSQSIISSTIEHNIDSSQFSFLLDNNSKTTLVVIKTMAKLNKDVLFNEVASSNGVILLYNKYALSGKEEDFFFQANEFFSFLSNKVPNGDIIYKFILDCKFDYETFCLIDLNGNRQEDSQDLDLRAKGRLDGNSFESNLNEERSSRIDEENLYDVTHDRQILRFMDFVFKDYLNKSKLIELSKISSNNKASNCKSRSKCSVY